MSRTEPQFAYAPVSGITPERARDARARAWAYVFERWREKQEAARFGDPYDAERIPSDGAKTILQD
jgi:hypothetical protein